MEGSTAPLRPSDTPMCRPCKTPSWRFARVSLLAALLIRVRAFNSGFKNPSCEEFILRDAGAAAQRARPPAPRKFVVTGSLQRTPQKIPQRRQGRRTDV